MKADTGQSGLAIGEEVRVDEFVNRLVVRRVELRELNPIPVRRSTHATRASASIPFLSLVARKSEADRHCRALFLGACGPDRESAPADVEREGGGNRVSQAVRHRNPQHDAWIGQAIAVIGEQMGREGGDDVLDCGVFVH